jgi:thiol:disulfide interchange protein DsbC
MFYFTFRNALAVFSTLSLIGFITGAVFAQGEEAQIRKNLKERMPQIQPIDEVRRTPMPGLFELRVDGSEIYYTDASGHFLLQGQLIDTRNQRNLTEERLQKIMAIDFKSLPFKDAITWVKGKGERKIAVFEDPNCGYCKRFERDIAKLDNVTVFVFFTPYWAKTRWTNPNRYGAPKILPNLGKTGWCVTKCLPLQIVTPAA